MEYKINGNKGFLVYAAKSKNEAEKEKKNILSKYDITPNQINVQDSKLVADGMAHDQLKEAGYNIMKEDSDISTIRQIVQHAINKEPSKMNDLVNKEIASRVMAKVDDKRIQVGKTLFGK